MTSHDDDQRFAYTVTGRTDGPDIVLLHGWGCDARFLEPQRNYFADKYRVIVIDLPGHGRSAPVAFPTVPALADAVGLLLSKLDSRQAVVVGHSMGGTVALELCKRSPHLIRRAVLVDTSLWPDAALRASIGAVDALLRAGRFNEAFDAAGNALFLPSDDPSVKTLFRESFGLTDKNTLVESFSSHLLTFEAPSSDDLDSGRLAYIGTETPLSDFGELAKRCPGITIGKTIGSGHFAPLLVSHQINSMIETWSSMDTGPHACDCRRPAAEGER